MTTTKQMAKKVKKTFNKDMTEFAKDLIRAIGKDSPRVNELIKELDNEKS